MSGAIASDFSENRSFVPLCTSILYFTNRVNLLSKAKISYLQSLSRKKFRRKYNNFIVEGDKSVRELLTLPQARIEMICNTEKWANDHADLLRPHKDKMLIINESELKKISQLTTPNQVLAVAAQFNPEPSDREIKTGISLYLDGIRDPGNLGTIIRTADWFGVRHVFCSPDCADVYNAKVLQATMGAFLRVKVLPAELSQLQEKFATLPIFGALMQGEDVFSLSPPTAGILVIGNEGKGISEENIALLTHQITIPAATGSGAESLNAGIATGIILSHLTR